VADIWVDGELRLSFRRTFTDEMMLAWGDLVSILESVVLSEESDVYGCIIVLGCTHPNLYMSLLIIGE
jgi:hypothetical protein